MEWAIMEAWLHTETFRTGTAAAHYIYDASMPAMPARMAVGVISRRAVTGRRDFALLQPVFIVSGTSCRLRLRAHKA